MEIVSDGDCLRWRLSPMENPCAGRRLVVAGRRIGGKVFEDSLDVNEKDPTPQREPGRQLFQWQRALQRERPQQAPPNKRPEQAPWRSGQPAILSMASASLTSRSVRPPAECVDRVTSTRFHTLVHSG